MLDRLSSLPVDLLIQILFVLPTKDVVATCTLPRKFRRAFPWIMSLDLSDSLVSNFLSLLFETVLRAHQSHYITIFRLHLGKNYVATYLDIAKHKNFGCEKGYYPDLKTTQINAWISFPTTHIDLKELDVRIHVREPGELPPAV
ncbi:hypothetical protein RDABS01_028624 [Bienertia sinuspersici]